MIYLIKPAEISSCHLKKIFISRKLEISIQLSSEIHLMRVDSAP